MKLSDARKSMLKLKKLKEQVSEISTEIGQEELVVMSYFEEANLKKLVVDGDSQDEWETFTATLVQSVTTVLDEDALRSKLTKKQLASITVQIIDKKLLESAMARGEISPALVAECSIDKPRSPYLRFTTKEAKA